MTKGVPNKSPPGMRKLVGRLLLEFPSESFEAVAKTASDRPELDGAKISAATVSNWVTRSTAKFMELAELAEDQMDLIRDYLEERRRRSRTSTTEDTPGYQPYNPADRSHRERRQAVLESLTNGAERESIAA